MGVNSFSIVTSARRRRRLLPFSPPWFMAESTANWHCTAAAFRVLQQGLAPYVKSVVEDKFAAEAKALAAAPFDEFCQPALPAGTEFDRAADNVDGDARWWRVARHDDASVMRIVQHTAPDGTVIVQHAPALPARPQAVLITSDIQKMLPPAVPTDLVDTKAKPSQLKTDCVAAAWGKVASKLHRNKKPAQLTWKNSDATKFADIHSADSGTRHRAAWELAKLLVDPISRHRARRVPTHPRRRPAAHLPTRTSASGA